MVHHEEARSEVSSSSFEYARLAQISAVFSLSRLLARKNVHFDMLGSAHSTLTLLNTCTYMHCTENVVSMWKDLRAISGGDTSRKLFKKYISSRGKSGISLEILMHHQSMTWLGDPCLQASLEIHSIFLRTYKRDASRCLCSVYPPLSLNYNDLSFHQDFSTWLKHRSNGLLLADQGFRT